MAVTYPLEQLRTLAQAGDTANDLLDLPPRFRKFGPLLGRVAHAASLDRQGLERLYQGCPAVIQTLALSNFLYFFLNAWAKKRLPALSQVMRTLAASSFAASVAVIATEPLWRANTVLRTIPRETAAGSSLLSQLIKLVREEGVAAQWNGVSVSLWLVCNPVIQFCVYEMIKRRVLRGGAGAVGESLTATQGFVIGAVSKAIAAITTYPLSLAQTRLRLNKDARMLRVVCQIVREKGPVALYRGYSAKFAQTILTAAFMFGFYERFRLFFVSALKRAKF